MSKKLISREEAYNKLYKKHGLSPETILARARTEVATTEHESTPEGIKALKAELEKTPHSKTLQRALNRATLTRQMQVNALNEIKNGRADKLANIYSNALGFFDKEETHSIIESVRETYEQKILHTSWKHSVPVDVAETQSTQEEYDEYLKQLALLATKPETKKLLEQLKMVQPPSSTLLKAYKNIFPAINKSREQLKTQLEETAVVQNTSVDTVQAYYEAYREQYKKEYSHLPSKNQPNPPEAWVRGEFSQAGFSKNPTTRFAPHDPASLYAIYRLQTDDSAIPDYQKQTKQFLTVQEENDMLKTSCYTNEGKLVKTFTIPKTTTGLAQLHQEMEGKIFLTSQSKNPKTQTLDPHKFVTKYYDYPTYDPQYLNEQQGTDTVVDLFFQTRKKTKQLWKSKTSRADIPVAEPTNRTRWAK